MFMGGNSLANFMRLKFNWKIIGLWLPGFLYQPIITDLDPEEFLFLKSVFIILTNE